MKISESLTVLGEYTADQWGMVTTAQATAAGVDSVTLYRLADVGHLHPVRRGVYAVATAPISPHRDVQAAWLALNPSVPAWERPKLDPDGAVVSHRTAAAVHELGDMLIERIELTVPRRRESSDPLVQLRHLRKRGLTDDDVTLVDGLPVTTAERTIEDLLADHVDASHVAGAVKDGYRAGKLDLAALDERVGPYARRYGVKSRDGADLVDFLLEQIGTSRTTLANPARSARDVLSVSGISPELRAAAQQMGLSPTLRRQLQDLARSIMPSSQATLTNALGPDELALLQRGIPASTIGLLSGLESVPRSRRSWSADDANPEEPARDERE